ncbi:MAG TPA: tetratricopeptide repeat protein, partial [Chthoniobacterales bacterium]
MQRTFAAITSVATFLLLHWQPPLRAQEPVPLNVPNESLHAQANALFEAGRFSEALPLAEQLVAARREQLGAEHVDVARSLHFLGLIHDRLEHGPEAERHYLEAVAMAERLLGPEHLLVALSAQQLGDWYCRQRRAEAEQWLARALRIREQQLGDSAEVAETLESLARWHLQRETDGEGFPLAERAAQICFTSLQWPDDRTARAFDTLGALAKRLGKLEVAISAREQTFWSYEALYGWSEVRTHRGGRFLARHLMEAGELVRARALLDRIVHAPMPKGTAEERGLAWSALGECFAKQKEVEKAVEAHRQCVLLENQIAGGGDSRTIMHAKVEIANALFSLKRFSEAEPLYLDRLERFAKAGNALQVRFMHEWLGSFYAQWGDTEKAERYLLESLALAERLPNQPHLAVGDAAFALAKFLKERGEFVRAAPLFERSFDVHATLLDEAKWDLFRLEEAAWFYEKTNNPRAMELSVRLSQLWEK